MEPEQGRFEVIRFRQSVVCFIIIIVVVIVITIFTVSLMTVDDVRDSDLAQLPHQRTHTHTCRGVVKHAMASVKAFAIMMPQFRGQAKIRLNYVPFLLLLCSLYFLLFTPLPSVS